MKKSRFSESQIVAILKEVDAGRPVAEVIRKHGISQATYYTWKSKHGGLEASDLKRLKEAERELSEYKTMVAELSHENRALRSLIEKNVWSAPRLQGS
jgi:putative transposase